jgi:hypothetical protein
VILLKVNQEAQMQSRIGNTEVEAQIRQEQNQETMSRNPPKAEQFEKNS